jgi:hypothetical protein
MAKKTYKPTHVLIHVDAGKYNNGTFSIIPFSRHDTKGMWNLNKTLEFSHYLSDIPESELTAESCFEALSQAASDTPEDYAVILTVSEYLSGATKKKKIVSLGDGLTYTGSEILELTKGIKKDLAKVR